MSTIEQTIQDPKEPQFRIDVTGDVAMTDPSYQTDDVDQAVRDRLSFQFEATGTWNVKVTPLKTVPDHRNGALIAVREGTEFDTGSWIKEDRPACVDSATISFFPLERGRLDDWELYWSERQSVAGDGMVVLAEVDGTLVCSSGLGDGAYDVWVRTDEDGRIDGVKVDLTPSEAAMSVLYS